MNVGDETSSGLLTPGDVEHQRFHTHRLVEGYDMDEVDDFLDRCAETILRMAVSLAARAESPVAGAA
jgi:DivIVA domain-containing protein